MCVLTGLFQGRAPSVYCLLCCREYRWVAVPTSSFKALKCRDSPSPTPALLPPKGLFVPTHFLTSPVPSPASQLQLPLRSGMALRLYTVLASRRKDKQPQYLTWWA